MTNKTWRQRWLLSLSRLLGGETSPRRHKTRRRIVPWLEQLESRLAPATTFSIANNSVIEPAPNGTVNLDFTVTRSGDLTSQVTVAYTTVAGTAKANTDFTRTTGTTTFASGSPTAIIAIPVFGNGVFDNPSLTFSVQLTGIVNVVGPPVTFAARTNFPDSPASSVAVGDFNGDGKPDLATANNGSYTLSVLLNTTAPGAAAPSFAAKVDFAAGAEPYSLAVADLNGDGRPDLAVVNRRSDTVSVFLNTTAPGAFAPSFAAPTDFAVGADAVSLTLADFNGDGRPDIAVVNYKASNTVSVLLNTTTPGATAPSFAAKVDFAVGANPRSVAAGDLNGDGRPDLVVVNSGSNTVSVLMNTTAPGAAVPSFAVKADFAVGSQPSPVALGDLNGDGRLDLVVGDEGTGALSVLVNTTAPGAVVPSFAPVKDFSTGGLDPRTIVFADLNGDGKPDLAVANIGSYFMSILVNTTPAGAANPSLALKTDFPTDIEPGAVAAADFNGDGRPDLAVANGITSAVSVFLNTTVLGAATIVPDFPQAATLAVSSGPISVAVGDINGDGKPDVVVANYGSNTVSVLLNTTAPGAAAPTFAPKADFAVETQPTSVAVADLNGDGKLDLIVANFGSASVSVLLNTTAPGATAPSFASKVDFAAELGSRFVAVADLNGDGKLDLIVANDRAASVSVLLNTTAAGAAAPMFATKVDVATGNNPFSVAVGDFNGDGLPDLVVANAQPGPNSVSVLLNMTAPGSTTPTFTRGDFAAGIIPISVAVADLNGDGKPDLVVANQGANNASVLLNTTTPGAATPSFASKVDFAAGAAPTSVAVADLNGDGRPDLVLANQGGNVSVLLNTTTAGAAAPSFAPKVDYAAGVVPFSVAVGDFNGDGRPDLVVANRASNSFSVLLNTPETITTAAAVGTITENESLRPSVSVAFGPFGEVVEVVNSAGVLTQYSAAGAQVLGGGVRYANIAFGPNGYILEVVSTAGILTQFTPTGHQQLGGAGVESASVAFGPAGEVLEVASVDGSLRQFSAAGVQVLAASGVVSASVAFGPGGEVVDIVSTAGFLTQYDATGAHPLGGAGVQSAGVASLNNSEVLDIIFADGTLDQFDAFGVHRLGMVS